MKGYQESHEKLPHKKMEKKEIDSFESNDEMDVIELVEQRKQFKKLTPKKPVFGKKNNSYTKGRKTSNPHVL